MRTTGSASFRYDFIVPPREAGQLPTYLNDELRKVASSVNRALEGSYELQSEVPDKPRAGMVRYADGVNFVPGHAAGLFFYTGSAWTPVTQATGTAVLVGGTKVVTLATVTANSRIFLTSQVDGGTPGWLRVSARSVGASFTITSSSGTDTSTVAYWITEP